ncbi:unnamed protein product [Meloidogyne enterolobii]|uniref:Uncharacterized protein n=1 Tax=Meloidogyne enterolobii TaxID=390850 RepID=A0ACB0XTH6_MELEN
MNTDFAIRIRIYSWISGYYPYPGSGLLPSRAELFRFLFRFYVVLFDSFRLFVKCFSNGLYPEARQLLKNISCRPMRLCCNSNFL